MPKNRTNEPRRGWEYGDAAGILFRARGPLYLLTRRKDTHEWAFPAGHLEKDETPRDAAQRECVEEIGSLPDGEMWMVRQHAMPRSHGLFTAYIKNVAMTFSPTLNEEADQWGWFPASALPSPMMRQAAETIERISGNEADISRRMAEALLVSPQRYENVWLFDVRITGTGASYRVGLDEYVYRPQEHFLTEEFVQRCHGLPLVFEHPKKSLLNTEEFRDRVIGSVIYPYIKGDEVRGIVKVFDGDAAQLMTASHASTSPAVVFRDAGSTETVTLHDGSTVFIEGKPSYVDHLAICENGVWDKGGAPTGVQHDGDIAVDDKEEKVPAWADALMKRCDELHARFDAFENKGEVEERDDAEGKERKDEHLGFNGLEKKVEGEGYSKEAAEKIAGKVAQEKKAERKDSEEAAEKAGKKEEKEEKEADKEVKNAEKEGDKEREEERADSQRREEKLKERIASMEAQIASITRPLSHEDRDALSAAQARADSLGRALGVTINAPLHGESPVAYRKRLAAKFQKHSESIKDIKLDSLDDQSFAVIEDRIYADAQTASRSPAVMPAGRLIEHTDMSSGRPIKTYTGDPNAWMAPFKAVGYSARINRDAKEQK